MLNISFKRLCNRGSVVRSWTNDKDAVPLEDSVNDDYD
jgi:hypothetical protein